MVTSIYCRYILFKKAVYSFIILSVLMPCLCWALVYCVHWLWYVSNVILLERLAGLVWPTASLQACFDRWQYSSWRLLACHEIIRDFAWVPLTFMPAIRQAARAGCSRQNCSLRLADDSPPAFKDFCYASCFSSGWMPQLPAVMILPSPTSILYILAPRRQEQSI